MSSAGNRGMISNNAGSSNWSFPKRNSGDASANNSSTAERRRVSAVLPAEKELSLLPTSHFARHLQRDLTTYLHLQRHSTLLPTFL